MINLERAGEFKSGKVDHTGTVYLTAADEDGNMISLIQSNYRGIGSGMVPPELGFMLQNRGELFDLEKGNQIPMLLESDLFIPLFLILLLRIMSRI